METPFKITFQKEVRNNISNEEIINNFITNLKIKSFNSFNKTDNNLIASNNIKSFWDFNKVWKDAEKVNIEILDNTDKKKICYTLDFFGLFKDYKTALIIVPIIAFIFYSYGKFDAVLENFGVLFTFLFFLIFITGIKVIEVILLILRHRNIFRNTMKYGAGNINLYDWKKIMKNKTDKELKEIINGRSNYSDRVIIFAKKEYKKRHSENTDINLRFKSI